MKRIIAIMMVISAVCGCVDTSMYYSDREHFRERLNCQSHRLYNIETDLINLKRGYSYVPVTVMITNKMEGVKW